MPSCDFKYIPNCDCRDCKGEDKPIKNKNNNVVSINPKKIIKQHRNQKILEKYQYNN
jgi:hypothetical protein